MTSKLRRLACALSLDLALLPQGDLTEVGEKGNFICYRTSRISDVTDRYYCKLNAELVRKNAAYACIVERRSTCSYCIGEGCLCEK